MLAAADRAAAALAFERAARLYERALELLSNTGRILPRPEERALQAKLGDALSNAGRGAQAARAYRTAAVGANAAEGLDLQRRVADQLLRCGHFDEGLTAIQEVLASIGMKLPAAPWQALLALVFWRVVLAVRGMRYKLVDSSQVSARDLMRIDVCYAIASSLSLIDPICGNLFHARNLLATLRAGEPKRVARALAIEVSYRGHRRRSRCGRTRQRSTPRRGASRRGGGRALRRSRGRRRRRGWRITSWGASRRRSPCATRRSRSFVEQCAGATWETFTMRFFALHSLAHLGRLARAPSAPAPRRSAGRSIGAIFTGR